MKVLFQLLPGIYKFDYRKNAITSENKRFLIELTKLAKSENNKIFTYVDLCLIVRRLNILHTHDLEKFIDKMNSDGHLLLKGGNTYELAFYWK